jgi:hypothetical protein
MIWGLTYLLEKNMYNEGGNECGNCIQFLTSWSGHIVPKNFFCELIEGHENILGESELHQASGVSDNQKFTIRWGNERKKSKKTKKRNLR